MSRPLGRRKPPVKRKNRSGKRLRKPGAKVGHPVLKLRAQQDRHVVVRMVAHWMIAVLSGRSEAPAALPTALLAVAETQGYAVPFIDDDSSLVMIYDNAPKADGSGEVDSAAERNRRRLRPVLERLSSADAMADPDMVWLCHNVTAQIAMRAPLLIGTLLESDIIRDLFKVYPGEEFRYRLFANRPHLLANYCACASGENDWWKGQLEAGPDLGEVLSLIEQIAQAK